MVSDLLRAKVRPKRIPNIGGATLRIVFNVSGCNKVRSYFMNQASTVTIFPEETIFAVDDFSTAKMVSDAQLKVFITYKCHLYNHPSLSCLSLGCRCFRRK